MPAPTDADHFDLGDVTLQSGITLRGATLAYKTYGTLADDKSNVVVYPTWYSGWHTDNEWLIGPGRALDPAERFIVIPNMLGNGLSSSPSNTPSPEPAEARVMRQIRTQAGRGAELRLAKAPWPSWPSWLCWLCSPC